MLGDVYAAGRGVEKNDVEAMKWDQRAAEGGDAEAQYNSEGATEVGPGVPKDMTESAKWLLKAAAQGHPIAMFNLALYHEEGKGVPRDLTAAVGDFREASDPRSRQVDVLPRRHVPPRGRYPAERSKRLPLGTSRR